MSFYGNQYLEFQKFFYNFKTQTSTSVTIPTPSARNIEATPRENHDTLQLNSGNRWIDIQPIDTGSIDPAGKPIYSGIKLFHSAPGTAKNFYKGFSSTNTQLKYGDQIKSYQFGYDEAGHLKSATEINYNLPTLTLKLDSASISPSNNTLTFSTDNWINFTESSGSASKITHTTFFGANSSISTVSKVSSLDGAEKLNSGDTLKIPVIHYDKAGHITEISNSYLQLPILDIQADISSLESKMGSIINRLSGSGEVAEPFTKIALDGDVKTLRTDVTDLRKDLGIKGLTELYPTTAPSRTQTAKFTSITTLVGSVSEYSKNVHALLGQNSNEYYSIGGAISSLCTKIQDNQSAAASASASFLTLKMLLINKGILTETDFDFN